MQTEERSGELKNHIMAELLKASALGELAAGIEAKLDELSSQMQSRSSSSSASPPLPPAEEVSMDAHAHYVTLRKRVIEIGAVVAHEATKLTLAVAVVNEPKQYDPLFAATSKACEAFVGAVAQMALFTTSLTLKRLVFGSCIPVLRAMATLVRAMVLAVPQMADGTGSAPTFATGVVHEKCEDLSTALPTSVKMALKRAVLRSVRAVDETIAEFEAVAAAAEADGTEAVAPEGGFTSVAVSPEEEREAAAESPEAAAAAAAAAASAADEDDYDVLFCDGTEEESPSREELWRIRVGVAAMQTVSTLWRQVAASVHLLPAPLGSERIAWVDAVADGTASVRDRLVDLGCALYVPHDAEELGGAASAADVAVEQLAATCAAIPLAESDAAAAASASVCEAAEAVRTAMAQLRA